MIYEEFVSCHSKLINWNQSWEFIFKYTKPLFDKFDSEWFYKWIADNITRYDLCNNFEIFKNNWRLIQKYLKVGRICYICGEYRSKFSNHLSIHNLTPQDWYDEYTQVNRSNRICPICGNPLPFVSYCNWQYRNFCCVSHSKMLVPIDSGLKAGWTESEINLYNKTLSHKGEVGGKIGGPIGSKVSCELYGSVFSTNLSDYQIDNLCKLRGWTGKDDIRFINEMSRRIEHQRYAGSIGCKARNELYGIPLNHCGYESKFIFPNKIFNLRSQYELWTLLYLLFIENINYNNINYEVKYSKCLSDFEITYYNKKVNIEIHDSNDLETIKYKKLFTEKYGVEFKLVSFDEVEDYYNKLLSILKVDKIYDELVHSNKILKLPYCINYSDILTKYLNKSLTTIP